MKWFLFFAVLFGAYVWLLLGTTNTMVDRTMQMHQQYQQVAEQADHIAAGNQ